MNPDHVEKTPLEILVISLDVPFPDDYGGAKDIWARTSVLFRNGWSVDLVASYLDAGRKEAFLQSSEAKLFRHMFLFPRLPLVKGLLSLDPYDLVSRRVGHADLRELLKAIGGKHYDLVVVEGFHSMLTFDSLRGHVSYKRSVLRVLNIESEYYRHLYESEPNCVKACYYRMESAKYNRFCREYPFGEVYDAIFHISSAELNHPIFKGIEHQYFVPPFLDLGIRHPGFDGRKDRFLYVGNLNLPDNRLAVLQSYRYLADLLVDTKADYRICGRSDRSDPLKELRRDKRVAFRFNVDSEGLMQEYNTAKIFVNFSANRSGVKLKLLDALSHGLPALSNENGCTGSGLEHLVINVDEEPREAVRDRVRELLTDEQAWLEHSKRTVEGFAQFLAEQKRHYVERITALAS